MQSENLFVPGKIRLHSGRYIDPLNADPDDILIEDIAHGLSLECRFGGHSQELYTVAEHSIWCCLAAPPELKLPALLHDASEGLGLRDLPTPIKERIPGYKDAEIKLMSVICSKFGVTFDELQAIKKIDYDALVYEFENVVCNHNYSAMSSKHSKDEFIRLYNKYRRI